jgi:hypothetical protein
MCLNFGQCCTLTTGTVSALLNCPFVATTVTQKQDLLCRPVKDVTFAFPVSYPGPNIEHPKILLRILVTIDGVWIGIGFIELLQNVTIRNYSAIAKTRTLQCTTARTKSFQSAGSSSVIAW